MHATVRRHTLSVMLALAAMVGLLAPSALVGRPRAAAQEAPAQPLQVINLGHVEVRAAPDVQVPLLPPGGLTAQTPIIIVSRPVSFEEAAATVDFAIVQPTWLPSADYQLWQVQVLGDQEVILYYRDTTVRLGQEPPREIAIHERRWATIGTRGVPASLEAGSIASRPAAFWTLTLPAPALPDGAVTRLMAAWEREELFLEFNTAGISREQLIQVAESVSE